GAPGGSGPSLSSSCFLHMNASRRVTSSFIIVFPVHQCQAVTKAIRRKSTKDSRSGSSSSRVTSTFMAFIFRAHSCQAVTKTSSSSSSRVTSTFTVFVFPANEHQATIRRDSSSSFFYRYW
ncbi:unnamed protein product, partial [Pylaiella littoralis]